MKSLFLTLSFSFCTFCIGQNVVFTDVNFKNKLLSSSPTSQIAKNQNNEWFAIDQNGNGNISFTEASQVAYLDVSNSEINSISGITRFYNITTLICSDNNIQNLDLQEDFSHELTFLEHLDCSNNQISVVNYSGGNNLNHFNASNNQLSHLSFFAGELPVSGYLDIRNNSYTELKIDTYRSNVVLFENNPIKKLNYLNWYESDLEIIQIPTLEEFNLQSISRDGYNFNSLIVNNLPALKKVFIASNGVNPFDVELKNNPVLDHFYVANGGKVTIENLGINEFDQLIISCEDLHINNLPKLEHLKIDEIGELRSMTEMNFENLPMLHTLMIRRPLETLNLGALPKLKNLTIDRITSNMNSEPAPMQLEITNAKFPLLEKLELNDLELNTNLSIENLTQLKTFKNNYNKINNLTIRNLPNLEILESFNVIYTNLQEDGKMKLENFPKLKDAKLSSFNENGNTVKQIYFSNLPLLEKLYFSIDSDDTTTGGVQLIELIDLSTCPTLNDLSLWFNVDGELDFLNLRNGNNSYVQLRLDDNINHICVDDENEMQEIIEDIGEGAEFSFDCNLVLNESDDRIELQIYPNPTNDILQIHSKAAINNVEVYDFSGKLLKILSVSNQSISTKELPKGIYLFKINFSNNTTATRRIIKD